MLYSHITSFFLPDGFSDLLPLLCFIRTEQYLKLKGRNVKLLTIAFGFKSTVLVRVIIDMMKHHDQKQLGEGLFLSEFHINSSSSKALMKTIPLSSLFPVTNGVVI